MAAPKTTKYDDETLAKPQSTSPGDAPADTHDPKERVSSGRPDKAAAAAAGHQTVNTVVEVAPVPTVVLSGVRTEVYSTATPSGGTATFVHNYDTGKTSAPKTWTATTAYALGDYVIRTDKVLECTTAGTSGASAPAAPGAVGGTVTDGTVIWTRRT